MILWINGAFGSGKSTVARILHRRIKPSFIYDPEQIGYFMRKHKPAALNLPDFQDEPLWRAFNRDMLRNIAQGYEGTVIVPMTLYNPNYYEEIIGQLRESGVVVKHYLLGAAKDTIHRRLRKRLDGRHSWPAAQTDKCLEGFLNPVFENQLDTERLTAKEAAALIMELADIQRHRI